MLLDIRLLDDATRPLAPKLDGVTEAQRAPGRHLAMIHDHFRGDMATLRSLIERAQTGAVSPAEVEAQAGSMPMLANYRRFGNLCGQHCQIINLHHSIEDRSIFPALRAEGDAFRRVADRLEEEHVIVHALLERLVDAINGLSREPGSDTFAACSETYDMLEKVLLSHFGYEEEQIGDALGYFRIGG